MLNGDFDQKVWIPHPVQGYALGKIMDIGAEDLVVQLLDGGESMKLPYSGVFPAEDDIEKDAEDNCALIYLNEASLLHNCRIRYYKKHIYTYVADILISINPYEQLPELYDKDVIQKYQGKSIGVLPPHLYAIADKAFRDMKRHRESQSIIISGESGAGKTECQKYILKYLCESWGSAGGLIEQKLLEANPILESFGNAKTLRNNNSSRFGKFVEIHFDSKFALSGGVVSHYLLERSRICFQHNCERNYHVFYQLIAGASEEWSKRLHLRPLNEFNYLNKGCTKFFLGSQSAKEMDENHSSGTTDYLNDEILDDKSDFMRLLNAFKLVGFKPKEVEEIFEVVSSILHLGNIQFKDDATDFRGSGVVDNCAEFSLKTAALLLGLDYEDLRFGLLSRLMQPTKAGKKGTLYKLPLQAKEAAAARDALAKTIYSRLFDWIVNGINKRSPVENTATYVGVLDVAGFELFDTNLFEQFCINYCNEKLQNFFNERILKNEQDLYEMECLDVPKITYDDNGECLEVFERKRTGLLDLLDDEARLPTPKANHFTAMVHQNNAGSKILLVPRKSQLREHRMMKDDEGFLVRHYAGITCYETAHFIEKNNDALHKSLEYLMAESKNMFISSLFTQTVPVKEIGKYEVSRKLVVSSISNKFRQQLQLLLKKLKDMGTNFVRCVKPNMEMKPGRFEGAQILKQLKCAGMDSVMKVMQAGYPSRTSFNTLYATYQEALPPLLKQLDSRMFCKCLFHAFGLDESHYKFGLTKVFFRAGKFAAFDQMLRQDQEQINKMIDRARTWLYRARWRKAQYGIICVIKLKTKLAYRAALLLKIQSVVRGFLARRLHRPRIQNLRNVQSLAATTSSMPVILSKMTEESRAKWAPEVASLKAQINQLIIEIKQEPNIPYTVTTSRFENLVELAAKLLQLLSEQVDEDERKNIVLIEEKLRQEKEREIQRKIEEENKEEAKRQQAEKERMVNENLKKAAEEASRRLEEAVSGGTSNTKGTKSVENCEEKQSIDVIKWCYDDLRKTINSSKDVNLVAACKSEFHRRFRAYNEWKSLYANKGSRSSDFAYKAQSDNSGLQVESKSSLASNQINLKSENNCTLERNVEKTGETAIIK